jgi:hypothetical protein
LVYYFLLSDLLVGYLVFILDLGCLKEFFQEGWAVLEDLFKRAFVTVHGLFHKTARVIADFLNRFVDNLCESLRYRFVLAPDHTGVVFLLL